MYFQTLAFAKVAFKWDHIAVCFINCFFPLAAYWNSSPCHLSFLKASLPTTYCGPGALLRTSHLILTTTLQDCFCYHPHFLHETKAEMWKTLPWITVNKWQEEVSTASELILNNSPPVPETAVCPLDEIIGELAEERKRVCSLPPGLPC